MGMIVSSMKFFIRVLPRSLLGMSMLVAPVAVSGRNNIGNYNNNDNNSLEHVGVNVDLLGSVQTVMS